MSWGHRSRLAGIVGLVAGTAVAGATYLLRRRRRGRSPDRTGERLETAVVDALCADEIAGACPIDVAAAGPGLIELSGRVPDQNTAARAAEVAGQVMGVHTVVNRLTVERTEQQWDSTRRRYFQGDPGLRASGWEGLRSGMGARRREEETDPARADDSQPGAEDAIGLDGGMR